MAGTLRLEDYRSIVGDHLTAKAAPLRGLRVCHMNSTFFAGGVVEYFRKRGPWIWRCHLDIAEANPELTRYLRRFADQFSAAVVILDEYKQDFTVPQVSIMPAIDPMKDKSQRLSENQIRRVLRKHGIPTDLPIVTQISRFDRWKDPVGVVDAFEKTAKVVPATLVMLGNRPQDDPEENEVFDALYARRGERVIVLDVSDNVLVSALQQEAVVVLQKSLREGFGLTVSEALWQGTPVIGGNVGGIPKQIEHGVDLLSDPDKAADMGSHAREKVREKFLITRLVEEHLDLLGGFEPKYMAAG